MIIYEVLGNPVPWQAPKKGKYGFYDTKCVSKDQIVWQLKSQFNHQVLKGPINVHVTFYMPVPVSTSGIRKRQMLNGVIHHTCKPDRTNLAKLMEDCLERAGILSNDSIIVGGEVKKIYGDTPKTVVRIEVLDNFNKIQDTNENPSGKTGKRNVH